MPYSSIDNILKNVLDTGITNKFFWNHRKTFSFKDGVFYSYQEPIGFLHNGLLLVLLKAKNLGGEYFSQTTSTHNNKLYRYGKDKGILINTLKPKYENFTSEKEILCPITYELITEGYKTDCNHYFRKDALLEWLKKKGIVLYVEH